MYTLYWLNPITGQVASTIDAEHASWSIILNKTEELTLTVPKTALATVPATWWEPWTGGVLLTHTDTQGFEYPIIAGPITDWGTETSTKLDIKVAGLRKIFERRTIWQTLECTGTTLGQIAWNLAEHGMNRPGGLLNLEHGTPNEAGGRQRTYEGWNVANNLIGKRWTELSKVINGPDIMIRPQWANNTKTLIKWIFVHGTEEYPYINQDWTPDFDTTASHAEIGEVKIASSGKNLTNRVWCTGAGEGEGTAISWAENLDSINRGAPYLEDVISDSDQENRDILREKAAGTLAARQKMIDQVTLDFPASSEKTPLGTFFVGDIAAVTLDGWISVPSGTYPMRIIKMTGSLNSDVTLDFQEATY